ncbi:MAG: DUF2339 domain-containing protein [Desulfobacteraceae bacterium]|nr:DUF2339 domain-containing protein [Desulfobacteraceae bacterium]
MNDKLDELKKELFNLKTDFLCRIDKVEQKIHFFETQSNKLPIPKISPAQDNFIKTVKPQKPVIPDIKEVPLLQTDIHQPKLQATQKTDPHPTEKSKKTIITGLVENTLPLFGPVTAIFVKFLEIYKHYHSQGKAPVFFMTIAGIFTLVMGFGYLLQYSFSQFLGPPGKVTIGFTAAIGITLCGIIINQKRTDMDDYASSLIGLGMILSYLCAYFTGSFYNLISDFWTFVLLAAITGVAYALAIIFETRIVAFISLLGGTFTPLLMAQAGQSYQVYLAYVLILVIAMLHLSRRINWQMLANTSMIVSFVVIEYVLTILSIRPAIPFGLIILIHFYFYVFSIYNSFEILKQTSLTKTIIISFSSNLFFYLFALNQLVHENGLLGKLYLLNALILTTIFFSIPWMITSSKKISLLCKKPLQMICLLTIGLLSGFGILALTAPDFLGLAWGVEALILLYMGTRFNIIQVRMEAHVLLILSFLSSAWHCVSWIAASLVPPPEIFQLNFGYGWMNLMFTGILLWPYILLMEKENNNLIDFEKKWLKGCNEVLSVCLSLSFLMTLGLVWNQGIWIFSPVPMFYLLHRSKIKHLKFTEVFGLSHFLLLVVPMMTSAQIVESFFFVEQLALGKIARAEALFCLFFIAEFYRRYHEKSRLNTFAQILRQVFFCVIPLLFLPGVWHQYIYFFPFAAWLSVGICLALFCWLKYPALIMELKILVISSSLISIIACAFVKFAGWQGHGTLALTTGLAFYSAVVFFWKGLKKDPPGSEAFLFIRDKLSLFFSLSFYYLGIFLFIIIFESSGSAPLALTLMIGYFTFLFIKLPMFEPLKNNSISLYAIVLLFSSGMILIHLVLSFSNFSSGIGLNAILFYYSIFNILVLGLFGLLVHQRPPYFEDTRNRLGGSIFQLWGFHCLVCLTYIGALSQWFNKGFGPALSVALVLHATLVLFLTLKPRFQKLISLAIVLFVIAAGKIIFWDMNDFSLVQKVIAFIIIGAVLLGAAYQYQKMRTAILETKIT